MAQLAHREDRQANEHLAVGTPGHIIRTGDKQMKILAKSLFRELRSNGYNDCQIVTLSTELIGLLTTEIEKDEAR